MGFYALRTKAVLGRWLQKAKKYFKKIFKLVTGFVLFRLLKAQHYAKFTEPASNKGHLAIIFAEMKEGHSLLCVSPLFRKDAKNNHSGEKEFPLRCHKGQGYHYQCRLCPLARPCFCSLSNVRTSNNPPVFRWWL